MGHLQWASFGLEYFISCLAPSFFPLLTFWRWENVDNLLGKNSMGRAFDLMPFMNERSLNWCGIAIHFSRERKLNEKCFLEWYIYLAKKQKLKKWPLRRCPTLLMNYSMKTIFRICDVRMKRYWVEDFIFGWLLLIEEGVVHILQKRSSLLVENCLRYESLNFWIEKFYFWE